MATICGYKAVLLAADTLPRMCPMLTTAAGTIAPVACADYWRRSGRTSGHRHGAAALGRSLPPTDMRPASKEQVQSLGGPFVELAVEAKGCPGCQWICQSAGTKSFYQKQRELLGNVIAESDVVITAAVIPGKKSPVLVTKEMVARDVAGIGDRGSWRAERGGNCELTSRMKSSWRTM